MRTLYEEEFSKKSTGSRSPHYIGLRDYYRVYRRRY